MIITYFVINLILLISINKIDFSNNVNYSKNLRICVFIFTFNYRINKSIVIINIKS